MRNQDRSMGHTSKRFSAKYKKDKGSWYLYRRGFKRLLKKQAKKRRRQDDTATTRLQKEHRPDASLSSWHYFDWK